MDTRTFVKLDQKEGKYKTGNTISYRKAER